MFDLMTTGDPSFSLAASQAQSDFMTLVPGAAKMMANRTRPLSSTTSPASPIGAPLHDKTTKLIS